MMINFYDDKKIEIIKKKTALFRVFFYVILAIFIISEVLLSCFIEYKNSLIFKPIMVAIGILFSLLLPFIYYYFIFPNKWLIKRIRFMNDSHKYEIFGTVTSVQENKTLRRDVFGKEISIKSDNSNMILYFEENDVDFNFEINKSYTFYVSDNFIVSIEEISNE